MADYDAIVVGAGFSGIRALWELGQLGLTAKGFEAGSDVGGAWYWNRYPGARTDSEAWVYTMNFAPGSREAWNYSERYPAQAEVQQYLGRVADRFELRRLIQFDTRVVSAHYSDERNVWTVTTSDGVATTCRFFLPATGPLSVAKEPPFAGLADYKGVWLQTSTWPTGKVDLRGKRVAIVGTGATGVQIVPKIAPVVQQLTVFQRTPNYVLPGRNYTIDEHEAAAILDNYDATWKCANNHANGLAMHSTGKTVRQTADATAIRQVLDAGWERGGFHFQMETFDDIATDQKANEVAAAYIRQKIHAIVQDQHTADLLSPHYPFMSKRPPCGHFYYEAFNRPNVELVDIRHDGLALYEDGIRTTKTQVDRPFDVVIFALGFDAGTGALAEIDVRGSHGRRLRDIWDAKVETFAGVLVPGFPNMFVVCGPHIPFGNMPVVLDLETSWIGRTLRHMQDNRLTRIDASPASAQAWSAHLDDAFHSTIFAESAKSTGAWFVGSNVPGKSTAPLFYFGGVPSWQTWLDNEAKAGWTSMDFSPAVPADNTLEGSETVRDAVAGKVSIAA
ncbi:cyclohexanone monooxygenase [Grosmannia clavigera kw1407]|uniref:Cyclohexanone monooxygenase n=1 Tax=Grosmannia clavigera (strain kw1407 / UAMH 11150) TaxID=655863 RepID=F0X7B1_GROCL|nr:cyclohexanone monooxygenase [Grosmannia clavigera kw1407]EFX06635.1 cyclohexanone monooxygenase [Grosmannia clavigera kw1407]